MTQVFDESKVVWNKEDSFVSQNLIDRLDSSLPITDVCTLKKINVYEHQDRNFKPFRYRRSIGWDTETINGNICVIANSDEKPLRDPTIDSLFDFLLTKRYQYAINWFYCPKGYDMEVILKFLPREELDKCKDPNKDRQIPVFRYGDYKLTYIPMKKLSITKGHHTTTFYDVRQYYGRSLAYDYLRYIHKLPDSDIDILTKHPDEQDHTKHASSIFHDLPDDTKVEIISSMKMKKLRSKFTTRMWNREKKSITDYCIKDAKWTSKLGEYMVKLLHDSTSLYFRNYSGPAYITEKMLIHKGLHNYIPKMQTYVNSGQLPLVELAYNSYFGGWFEMYKRGFVGNTWQYDLNSAYPDAFSRLPDITKGKWIGHKTEILDNTLLGFAKVRMDIPEDANIGPLPFRQGHKILRPLGQFETFATIDELRTLDPTWYTILDSYQYLDEDPTYPFYSHIVEMYQQRQKLKKEGNDLQLVFKIMLNSLYGKTGQTRPFVGNIFNPIIFAFLTGFVRAKMYNFIKTNNLWKNVIAIATDGIFLTRPVDIGKNDKLGELSAVYDKPSQDTFFVQNGFYRAHAKWKQRGLGSLGTKTIENVELKEVGNELYGVFEVSRSHRLVSSIIRGLHSDIGKIERFEKRIDLNGDRKRIWDSDLKSLSDERLIVSAPLIFPYSYRE